VTFALSGFCLTAVADNCTPLPNLEANATWTAVPDACASASPAAGTGTCAASTLGPGTTRVTWTLEDDCGNVTTPPIAQDVHVSSPPVACIEGSTIDFDRSVCRTGAPFSLTLNGSCTLEDAQDDCRADTLDYSWSVGAPCTATALADPRTIQINIPDDGLPGCKPVETCVITLTARKRHPVVPAAFICTDPVTLNLHVQPRPVSVVPAPFSVCQHPSGTTDVPVDGSLSLPCVGTITGRTWSLLSCPGGTILNPADPIAIVRHVGGVAVPCTSCSLRQEVRNSEGCVHQADTSFQIRATPVADPGGPYAGCAGTVASPLSVLLNGSASTPVAACPGCTRSFEWTFDPSCTNVSPMSITSPLPTASVSVTGDTGATCEVCLVVKHCTGPQCVSTSVCEPFLYCTGPTAVMNWGMPLEVCRAIDYNSVVTPGSCPGPVGCAWTFPPDGTPSTSTACNPPVVIYATHGRKFPTLTVTQGPCSNPATGANAPCGVCVPSCTQVNLEQFDDFHYRVRCNGGAHPCTNGDAIATFDIQGLNTGPVPCCPSPGSMSLSGASSTLVLTGCGGGTETVTTTVAITGTWNPGTGTYQVTVTYPDDCMFNAIKRLGCDCDSPDLTVTLNLVATLTCSGGCSWPFNLSGTFVSGLELSCTNNGGTDCILSTSECSPMVGCTVTP
jgi:hypothetical protein